MSAPAAAKTPPFEVTLSSNARAAYPGPIAVTVVPAGTGADGVLDATPAAALLAGLLVGITMAVALKVRRRRAAAA